MSTNAKLPLLVISPYSNPLTLVEVVATPTGYTVKRNLSLPLTGSPQWQVLITNEQDLPSALYLFSVDTMVIINYNAIEWSVAAVVPLPQGLYPTQLVKGTTFNEYQPDQVFIVRANQNVTLPGEVRLLFSSAFFSRSYFFLLIGFVAEHL